MANKNFNAVNNHLEDKRACNKRNQSFVPCAQTFL